MLPRRSNPPQLRLVTQPITPGEFPALADDIRKLNDQLDALRKRFPTIGIIEIKKM
jgi:hypothetical protein